MRGLAALDSAAQLCVQPFAQEAAGWDGWELHRRTAATYQSASLRLMLTHDWIGWLRVLGSVQLNE